MAEEGLYSGLAGGYVCCGGPLGLSSPSPCVNPLPNTVPPSPPPTQLRRGGRQRARRRRAGRRTRSVRGLPPCRCANLSLNPTQPHTHKQTHAQTRHLHGTPDDRPRRHGSRRRRGRRRAPAHDLRPRRRVLGTGHCYLPQLFCPLPPPPPTTTPTTNNNRRQRLQQWPPLQQCGG